MLIIYNHRCFAREGRLHLKSYNAKPFCNNEKKNFVKKKKKKFVVSDLLCLDTTDKISRKFHT